MFFYIYLFVFVHFACCIYAYECKLVQMYAPLHITIPKRRFHLGPSCSQGGVMTAGKKEEYELERILRHYWWGGAMECLMYWCS